MSAGEIRELARDVNWVAAGGEPMDVEFDDHPQDECGVVGVFAPGEAVANITYIGMQELQHRGQSGAGIAVFEESLGRATILNGNGMLEKAVPFADPNRIDSLDAMFAAPVAVGHMRYSTSTRDDASGPFRGKENKDLVVGHNGHVEDMRKLAAEYGIDPDKAVSDSQLLAHIIDAATLIEPNVEAALHKVLPQIDGAYSLVVMNGKQLLGVRDPWGQHPLAIGILEGGRGYVLVSEAAALRAMGATFVRDVEPGEIVVIDEKGLRSSNMNRKEPRNTCMFEYIYIARPDGEVDGVNVQLSRRNMGRYLAGIMPVEADLVVGMPDSGLDAAQGYAEASGIPFAPRAIIKNPYAIRSFIEREGKREQILERKLRMSILDIAGARLVVVDDSLIKGKTFGVGVRMLRDAGAKEVHVRLASPRYLNPCYGGMDTRDIKRLIARNRTDEEIAELIGADSVAFNTVENVERAAMMPLGALCTACATGKYPFPVPDSEPLLYIPKG